MGLSPDGEQLLVAGWDGSGWLVELSTGALLQTLGDPLPPESEPPAGGGSIGGVESSTAPVASPSGAKKEK